MKFGITPTTLEVITEQICVRLVARTGLPRTVLFETLANDREHLESPPADRFILIRVDPFSIHDGIAAGALRESKAIDARIETALFCRYSDNEFRNAKAMRDKTRSTLALWRLVFDALHGWEMPLPTDATKSYLREPCRLIGGALEPQRLKEGPWSKISATWNTPFLQETPT